MAQEAILCIGAGRMGRGIAIAAAFAGHNVILLDAKQRNDDAFDLLRNDALDEISASLQMLAKIGALGEQQVPVVLERVQIVPFANADKAFRDAEFVFEAVPEILEAKRNAFDLFDKHAGASAILASTTSTILATELSKLTQRPEKTLNAHWLNPAFLVPLVEVSPSDKTNADTLERMNALLESMGKVPVTCKASPGYIVPRIQALAMNEAARLVEEGVASAEDVDRAVKYGFGLRFSVLGLLEFIDWGGGDILFHASNYLQDAFQDKRFAAPEIINTNMAQQRIGLKTGSGFFDYSGIDQDQYKLERLAAFYKALKEAGLARDAK